MCLSSNGVSCLLISLLRAYRNTGRIDVPQPIHICVGERQEQHGCDRYLFLDKVRQLHMRTCMRPHEMQ